MRACAIAVRFLHLLVAVFAEDAPDGPCEALQTRHVHPEPVCCGLDGVRPTHRDGHRLELELDHESVRVTPGLRIRRVLPGDLLERVAPHADVLLQQSHADVEAVVDSDADCVGGVKLRCVRHEGDTPERPEPGSLHVHAREQRTRAAGVGPLQGRDVAHHVQLLVGLVDSLWDGEEVKDARPHHVEELAPPGLQHRAARLRVVRGERGGLGRRGLDKTTVVGPLDAHLHLRVTIEEQAAAGAPERQGQGREQGRRPAGGHLGCCLGRGGLS
mmetsp:Transcript_31406/g.90110  ORF Transcript_31406/g.90110 Transcript_31406/m.90110 type:complete len:272 (-) Transcript_31406:70-885(-)